MSLLELVSYHLLSGRGISYSSTSKLIQLTILNNRSLFSEPYRLLHNLCIVILTLVPFFQLYLEHASFSFACVPAPERTCVVCF